MTDLTAVEDEEGTWGLRRAQCQWCRFYHHTEGSCIRHAPSPTHDKITSLADEIMRDLGKQMDLSYTPIWPSVEKTDCCGEFDRGAGLGRMTLEQQEALWPNPKNIDHAPTPSPSPEPPEPAETPPCA